MTAVRRRPKPTADEIRRAWDDYHRALRRLVELGWPQYPVEKEGPAK